jgi:hypothetical protein
VIEVREKSKQLVMVLESVQLAERDVPDYIEADHNKMTAKFTRIPGLSDVPYRGADGTEPRRRVLLALILTRKGHSGSGARRASAGARATACASASSIPISTSIPAR